MICFSTVYVSNRIFPKSTILHMQCIAPNGCEMLLIHVFSKNCKTRKDIYQLPRVTDVRTEEIRKNGIFTMLEQNPHIGQSKVVLSFPSLSFKFITNQSIFFMNQLRYMMHALYFRIIEFKVPYQWYFFKVFDKSF